MTLFGTKAPILEQLLELLFVIARADKEISEPEWAYLREVANIFGYDAGFERLSKYMPVMTPPHQVLGVAKTASLAEVRAAWMQLAKDHHPDQLIAKGMPAEFIDAATDDWHVSIAPMSLCARKSVVF